MSIRDPNSLFAVVVLPAVCAALGLAAFGVLGLLVGLTLPLVVLANLPERDDRIAELEARVEELED
ncbi:hypothetical protein [Salarchaeum japonicum]|uniref:Uncharacterized protein n=1 Tax=Salarchaeum japonicum TaxID=555573 RepID=A0AAV3SYU7_9EURY|nr:hypothetical protein [Salarchaeum japonicum]